MQIKILNKITKVAVHMALLSVFATQVVAQTLPAPEYNGPAVEPAYPSAFQDLDLSILSASGAASGTPEIAEWTRINKPGDSMMVVGHRLSGRSGDEYGRDTSFHFFPSPATGQLADGKILRLEDGKTTIKLPDNLVAKSMYLMWPRNEDGYGQPVSINQAEAWWAAPRSVAVGEVFSVFGRNLVRDEAAPVSYIYIQSSKGSGEWVASSSANPYKAEFKIPSGLANGEYTFWAHNGSGKRAGWSEPITLTVRTKHGWSDDQATWINVKTDFGAVGNGSANDYQAIADAVALARKGTYETVYFPAGTYAVSEKINVIGAMRIVGDGMDETTITTHSSYGGENSYGLFMMGGNKGQTEFHSMTFSSGKYLTQGLMDKIAQYRGAENMLFKNIRFDYLEHDRTANSEVINIDRSKNIIFEGCEFILTGALSLAYADEILIRNCDFYGINDIGYMISMSAADKVSVEDCTAQHYDSSDLNDGHGWSQGRFLNGSGSNGGIHDVYFGGNKCNDMMVRPGYYNQNTGEKFMTEHGHTVFRDTPSAIGTDTVTLSGLSEDFTGETVVVAGGKGLGQSRKIIGFSGGKLTLDRPWRVRPDSKSIIMVGEYMNRHVVYGNYFDGIPLATESDGTATTGVEPFGAQLNMIVDNNDFHELRKGISNWSMPSPVQGSIVSLQPNYFNMFMNNRFDKCRYGIENAIAIWNYKPTVWDTTMLGNVWRGNDIQNTVKEAIRYFVWQSDDTRIDMCVFDQNKADNVGDSVADGEDLHNQIWVGNVFTGIKSDSAITFSGDHIPALHDNTWNGYSSVKYGGSRPGGVLEMPYRSVFMGNKNAQLEVPVLNSGTDALNWSATSSQPWLKFESAAGSVSDENDSDLLTMSIDETQPSFAQATPAIVTISAGDQVKQMTVTYSEGASSPTDPGTPPEGILTGIEVFGEATFDEKSSAQFYCSASYSDGTTANVVPIWTEDSPFASIADDGTLTSLDVTADQVVTIAANFEGKVAHFSTTILFVAPVLERIEVVGADAIDEGTSSTYTCLAYYTDGIQLDVMPSWSEDGSATSIDQGGSFVAENVAVDTDVTISASYNGVVDSHSVVVRNVPPVITALTIVGPFTMDEGTSEQFSCVANYDDATTGVVVPSWVENASFASFSGAGLLNVGSVDSDQVVILTASLAGVSISRAVAVADIPAVLSQIEILGAAVLTEGGTSSYTCEAIYSDGSREVVAASWSASGAATIDNSGQLQADDVDSDQSAKITATYDGMNTSFNVAIQTLKPTVTDLILTGPSLVVEGGAISFLCEVVYSDGSREAVAPVWTLSSGYASISDAGVLIGSDVDSDRDVLVTASYGGFADSQTVTVTDTVLVEVTVTGIEVYAPANVKEMSRTNISCVANYSDGTSKDVSPAWTVDSSFALVNSSDQLVIGNIEGNESVRVTATYGNISETVIINVAMIGNEIIYPLNGFEGKSVRARLWGETEQEWFELGIMDAPQELVVEHKTITGQWYWLTVEELNEATGEWELAHANWLSM